MSFLRTQTRAGESKITLKEIIDFLNSKGVITKVTSNTISTGPFSVSYNSTGQTITSAGSLTLAHGLGTTPTLIQCKLKCTSAEGNYSVNDYVFIPVQNSDSGIITGVSVVPDATNLNVRYASYASVFFIPDKTTGGNVAITTSKWQFFISAWA